MPDAGFHFAQPWWLLALLLPGLVLYWQTRPRRNRGGREKAYAEPELLPWLTGRHGGDAPRQRRRLLAWAIPWVLLVIALAGPRWDFAQVSAFESGAALVVLLDISRSMDVTDVIPSRIARARQELQDLLQLKGPTRVGLIAFATVPQVITPVTEDGATLLTALPALSSELAQLQGSRPSQAIARARELLAGEAEESARAILLISDGDFEDPQLPEQTELLRKEGIPLHVLGLGTATGGPVPGRFGPFRAALGDVVVSRLEAAALSELAETSGGLYRAANFQDNDVRELLEAVAEASTRGGVASGATRVWNERFFLPALAGMLLLLPAFRRRRAAEAR